MRLAHGFLDAAPCLTQAPFEAVVICTGSGRPGTRLSCLSRTGTPVRLTAAARIRSARCLRLLTFLALPAERRPDDDQQEQDQRDDGFEPREASSPSPASRPRVPRMSLSSLMVCSW